MFGKFGGIVIIALSGAIIAGLILRPTPDLPPAMSIGVPNSNPAPVNTLETTADNQDIKPAVIEPVTSTVDSVEKKQENTEEAKEVTDTEKQPQTAPEEKENTEAKVEPEQKTASDEKPEEAKKAE